MPNNQTKIQLNLVKYALTQIECMPKLHNTEPLNSVLTEVGEKLYGVVLNQWGNSSVTTEDCYTPPLKPKVAPEPYILSVHEIPGKLLVRSQDNSVRHIYDAYDRDECVEAYHMMINSGIGQDRHSHSLAETIYDFKGLGRITTVPVSHKGKGGKWTQTHFVGGSLPARHNVTLPLTPMVSGDKISLTLQGDALILAVGGDYPILSLTPVHDEQAMSALYEYCLKNIPKNGTLAEYAEIFVFDPMASMDIGKTIDGELYVVTTPNAITAGQRHNLHKHY